MYLEIAAECGHRLAREALWSQGACSWLVVQPGEGGIGTEVPAGGSVYNGSAGIGLFFAELWNLTGDAEFRRPVGGAARHAYLAALSMRGEQVGLFSGRVGVAYFLARAARLLGCEQYGVWTRELLASVAGSIGQDRAFDVIGGVAGAIPAILRIASWIEVPEAHNIVRRMGEHLLSRAHRDAHGWWWGSAGWAVRGLTGFAHGAAGCAHGLLELFAATGDVRYRFAALQAIAYENDCFDEGLGNWPDFRRPELTRMTATLEGANALRDRLVAGEPLEPFVPRGMFAWCHGAPGIGLARSRAYELLGCSKLADNARIAASATAAHMRHTVGNASLCHGDFGNCEALTQTARVFRTTAFDSLVEEVVDRNLARMRASSWRWASGAVGGAPDRSLLMGDAGAAYFMLRRADSAVPSILLITSPQEIIRSVESGVGGDVLLANAHREHFFGRTIAVFGRLGTLDAGRCEEDNIDQDSPSATTYRAAVAEVQRCPDGQLRELLEDAFAPDRAMFEAASARPDLSIERADALRRPSHFGVDRQRVQFRLVSHARVITCEYDWDGWLAAGGEWLRLREFETHCWFVVYIREQQVQRRRLGRLAGRIADLLGGSLTGLTIEEMCARVSAEVTLASAQRDVLTPRLAGKLASQVEAMVSAGMLEVVRTPRAANTTAGME